ncbi:MAG: hypothetical protein QM737_15050 [Ferruginibacter sp.]
MKKTLCDTENINWIFKSDYSFVDNMELESKLTGTIQKLFSGSESKTSNFSNCMVQGSYGMCSVLKNQTQPNSNNFFLEDRDHEENHLVCRTFPTSREYGLETNENNICLENAFDYMWAALDPPDIIKHAENDKKRPTLVMVLLIEIKVGITFCYGGIDIDYNFRARNIKSFRNVIIIHFPSHNDIDLMFLFKNVQTNRYNSLIESFYKTQKHFVDSPCQFMPWKTQFDKMKDFDLDCDTTYNDEFKSFYKRLKSRLKDEGLGF